MSITNLGSKKPNKIPFALLIIVGLLIIIIANSIFVVSEAERGVLLRFREVVNSNLQPGLHWKLPFIDEVITFDGRVQSVNVLEGDYLTQEKKLLLVDSYAMWRIDDVQRYFTATGGIGQRARERLIPRINESLRNEFGRRTVYEVVAGEREKVMQNVLERVSKAAEDELGVEVLDIRVKKIDLPKTVSEDVYRRMRAERERDAREHRSQGRELAEGIRADADRARRVILAESYRDAQKLRGEGDAEATQIYAKAYNQDQEFFNFYRSLEAYRKSFEGRNNMMILEPDSEFFKYLSSIDGQPTTNKKP